ncbi:MAG: porin family protein, partial [Porphyromonas sp.]|nr:porin family protein [Porphyromonas sp.]
MLKRFFVLISLFLSASFAAFGQDINEIKQILSYSPGKARFMAGVIAGGNGQYMIFQPEIKQKVRLGYDAGIVLRADMGELPWTSIEAGIWLEASYSDRGWIENNEENPNLKYARNLRWINFPFMTHLMIDAFDSNWKLTLDAGPNFGWLLSETSESTYKQGENYSVVTQQHNMPVENKFAWGIGGGPGLEYHAKKWVF